MAESRPNIIFVLADQWRGDCLSVTGHTGVDTPNLDMQARQGVAARSRPTFVEPVPVGAWVTATAACGYRWGASSAGPLTGMQLSRRTNHNLPDSQRLPGRASADRLLRGQARAAWLCGRTAHGGLAARDRRDARGAELRADGDVACLPRRQRRSARRHGPGPGARNQRRALRRRDRARDRTRPPRGACGHGRTRVSRAGAARCRAGTPRADTARRARNLRPRVYAPASFRERDRRKP